MLKTRDEAKIKNYLRKKEGSTASYPYTKTLAVFSVNEVPFAYLESGRSLLELSLRADRELSKLLRTKYEEVSLGHKLDKRIWITIVLSGQLTLEELFALIDHSYQLAALA